MVNQLLKYFLPDRLDTSDWVVSSKAKYLIYGHMVTVLTGVLGMIVNIRPFDRQPFFIDLGLIALMIGNLFLLKWSFRLCRFNFHLITWSIIFVLATFINPLFSYEYYFLIWSVSAVMLFTSKLKIYFFFVAGLVSFHLPKLINQQVDAEFNYNPVFLFLMLLLIFQVFYATNQYYLSVINRKNQQLEHDKELITRQSEQIKEVNALQTRFFTNISHEIRTPLTLISGPVRQLIDFGNNLTDEQLKQLRLADQNGKRLMNLVEQILDISKLEAGVLPLHMAQADLSAFVRGIASSFEALSEVKKIDLIVETPEESTQVWFDKDSIEKILINLIGNAFKFSSDGGRIIVRLETNSHEQAVLTVADTGRGISEDQLAHIFERFYHTESDLQGSSGIGLSIVKALVDRLNGSIEVESTSGSGSTFKVTLPAGKHDFPEASIQEQTEVNHQTSPVALGTDDASSPIDLQPAEADRLLIIDDNEEIRAYLTDLLKGTYHILTAETGKQGIDVALQQLPDLILCDVMMPEKDGIEVTRILKTHELTSHIPIVLLTAKGDSSSKVKGLESTADDYVVKPFDRKELMARISTLLINRRKIQNKFSNTFITKADDLDVPSLDKQFLNKVLGLMEEHLADDTFTVEKLGELIGMSRSQLHRKLTAIIGQSPKKMIKTMRLQRALDLLKKQAGNVSEIAYMTGFSSPGYFASSFREEFGITPGEVGKKPINS
ncbi:hybrid sensor histidine kinase/response regulator transcription factor [Marinoscillum luteum]|uniref:histidine kinase n=1 Tax=Marinoscillum luteum TaxID=861051 RepID=A0ABW7NCZ3_9BACT